jgi:hypothetical protein
MATLTINLSDAQVAHLQEAASITGQDIVNYILDLVDDDARAKEHSLQDAEGLDAFAGLEELLSVAEAIGGGIRRSAAPYSPYDELGGCWMY